MIPVIDIENMTKKYGRHIAVDGLNLMVEKGEIFGFLGSNGAGKSTTIRCILGLIGHQRGDITLFNDSYASLKEAMEHIGYMPSEALFYPTMTAKEVIRFAAKSHEAECSREADRLCKLLDVPLNKKIRDLSLGNRKKVSIVCAMQHKPDLLILDEPTSGLDPLMQERFFQLILEAKAEGRTSFLSSHVLSEVKAYCDRLGILKNGKLLAVDTVENLMHTQKKVVTVWKDGETTTQTFEGKSMDLLQQLVDLEPDDILIEEPSLEDLFMHFYKEEGK